MHKSEALSKKLKTRDIRTSRCSAFRFIDHREVGKIFFTFYTKAKQTLIKYNLFSVVCLSFINFPFPESNFATLQVQKNYERAAYNFSHFCSRCGKV